MRSVYTMKLARRVSSTFAVLHRLNEEIASQFVVRSWSHLDECHVSSSYTLSLNTGNAKDRQRAKCINIFWANNIFAD